MPKPPDAPLFPPEPPETRHSSDERRHHERRWHDRRQSSQPVFLDTRCASDRRTLGRRQDDRRTASPRLDTYV